MDKPNKITKSDIITAVLVFVVVIIIIITKAQEVKKENLTPRTMNTESGK